MFLALLVVGIDRWPKIGAALAAALTTFLAAGLPHHSGLLLGALVGVFCGMIFERLRK